MTASRPNFGWQRSDVMAEQPRELSNDEACDFVYAAMVHVIEHAPEGVLILDRAKLHNDWSRKLLIEISDSWVAFSFVDRSTVQ